ncbi:MAG: type II toxin-antitoxin system VapC family toxin [Oscillospiraceae bacterium]|nr:type II toxin-antitoxin system VapC family toxin [Oscillospiraceae bacterium]
MKYLIDTHAVIWYYENSPELPDKIVKLIDNPANSIYICAISLWEIALKMNLGKLNLKLPLDELLDNINDRDFTILQIKDKYLSNLGNLPFIHKDPFDRLIVATALVEGLTIITIDENIQKYEVDWIW